ncbi:nuclear envelope protein Brr6 [Golovinomyces cichoracearum]|uniref:Nuclear envelope protein Brr6 n=1 Tax=Golovinomyces cichoracearum TaxID=62708 RepID=A0A420HYH9_9PEZI|nr:nuclear envelope protein Brr6 [Golovinomyces cichoracearum]
MFCQPQSHKRSHESPMDFEWQTHAPTDPKSPFPQSRTGQKGFDSVPPFFSLASQSPTPNSKFCNSSFTTPRKAFEPELLSETSGVDSSPGDQEDTCDTPDLSKSLRAIPVFSSGSTFRQPVFGKYGTDFLGTSPSRADHRRGKYSKTIIQKLRKRKRIDRDLTACRYSESDSGESVSRNKSRKNKSSKVQARDSQTGLLASFFDYIESHPNLPSILSFYAQLSVNFFIAGLSMFGVYTFWTTVQSDVDKASEQERSIALAQIAKCAQDFVINGCGSKNRAPVMEIPCNEFDLCMNRDPNSVGRARISAHTFAQIFNSFIEPISYKAMVFIVLIVVLIILVNNLAFGIYRSKSQPNLYPNNNSQSFQPWVSHLSIPNPSHITYPNQSNYNTGTKFTSTGERSVSQSSHNRGRSRSPQKLFTQQERSSSQRKLKMDSE